MEKYNRKAVFTELKEFCHISKDGSFIEVTEWYNGEGFDVTLESSSSHHIYFTWGQFKALKKLVKVLEKLEIAE